MKNHNHTQRIQKSNCPIFIKSAFCRMSLSNIGLPGCCSVGIPSLVKDPPCATTIYTHKATGAIRMARAYEKRCRQHAVGAFAGQVFQAPHTFQQPPGISPLVSLNRERSMKEMKALNSKNGPCDTQRITRHRHNIRQSVDGPFRFSRGVTRLTTANVGK